MSIVCETDELLSNLICCLTTRLTPLFAIAIKKADEPPTETSQQEQTNKGSQKQAQRGKAPTQAQKRTTTEETPKEAQEFKYWVEIMSETDIVPAGKFTLLLQDITSIINILAATIKTLKSKNS